MVLLNDPAWTVNARGCFEGSVPLTICLASIALGSEPIVSASYLDVDDPMMEKLLESWVEEKVLGAGRKVAGRVSEASSSEIDPKAQDSGHLRGHAGRTISDRSARVSTRADHRSSPTRVEIRRPQIDS